MPTDFYYPTTKNAIQKPLAAQLLSTASTGDAITFDDVDGVDNKPGILVINRVDSNGAATPSSREYISYTGTSGNTVLIETRNVDGSGAARTHAVGSVVEFVIDRTWGQRVIDQAQVEHNADGTHKVDITAEHNANGTHKSATVTTLKATQAEVATGTEDAKIVTPLANANVSSSALTGWIPSGDTWVYASASTFTIAGVDRTAIYTKGTRLKFTQTTAKYAVVVASSFSTDTTVTIAVNTDYTIANAAITAPYYSYVANPQGYPVFFNWTPTFSASGSMTIGSTTIEHALFNITNGLLVGSIKYYGTTGGSASTFMYFTRPVAPSSSLTINTTVGVASVDLNAGIGGIIGWGSDILYARRSDSGNWTINANEYVTGTFQYFI